MLKIRTWVLAAAALVLAPTILMLLYALAHVDRSEKDLIDAEIRFRAYELVHAVNERLAVSVQALETLSHSEAARTGDWKALNHHAQQLIAAQPHYTAVTLVDAQDTLLFVTALPYGPAPFNTRQLDRVREVFKSGRPNVSGPFTVPISPHPLVAVSVPVFQNRRVSHVLRMVMRSDAISQLLTEQVPPGWLAAIADRHGTVLARSVASERFVGQPASASFRAAIGRNDRSTYKGLTLEGIPNTSLVVPVHRGDWFAVIAVPDALVEPRYLRNMAVIGVSSFLIVALGVLVSLAISHFLARQALALEQAVGAGRTDTPPPWPLRVAEMHRVYQRYLAVSQREQLSQRDLVSMTSAKDEVQDLYERAPCGYHSLDNQGRLVRINQTELNWLGQTREQVLGRPFTDFFTPASDEPFQTTFARFLAQGHIENLEFDLLRADGSTLSVSISATLLRDAQGQPLMSRSTVFDITERKQLERRLQDLSNHDALTGLSNRRHFYERAASEVARTRRQATPLSLAMLDVDHFKQVNDRHGHAVGDQLLKALADTCRAELRQIDTIARCGGEEFVVMMPNTELDAAVLVLDRLRTALQALHLNAQDGTALGFTVSIGVTRQRPDESDVDAMLSRADQALYEAKRLGRNQVQVA